MKKKSEYLTKEEYFCVTCECGHVSLNKSIFIDFPVIAINARIAAKIARSFPRVRHDKANAIKKVKKIDYNQYKDLYKKNSRDPYLLCKNIQEQRKIDLSERLREIEKEEKKIKKVKNKHQMHEGKMLIRDQKKYFNNFIFYKEDYDYAY